MSVSDDFIRVLNAAKGNSNQGWMKRSEIVSEIYGEGMTVNAHHRSIFMRLVVTGLIEQRTASKGHLSWFEYRMRS